MFHMYDKRHEAEIVSHANEKKKYTCTHNVYDIIYYNHKKSIYTHTHTRIRV